MRSISLTLSAAGLLYLLQSAWTPEMRRRRIDYVAEQSMRREAAWLASQRKAGMMGITLTSSADRRASYLLVRRDTSSEAEVHARWDDLVIIRSGSGAIILGDSLVGSRYRAPGERAGGRFVNPYDIVVHAGDVVRIPAAVPHAFVVSIGTPLEYLVIKQRRQELPVRWFRER